MAAVPGPLPAAEAEALVRALQGSELRDIGGQGCGVSPGCLWGENMKKGLKI